MARRSFVGKANFPFFIFAFAKNVIFEGIINPFITTWDPASVHISECTVDSCAQELVLSRPSQATLSQAGQGSSLEISLKKIVAKLRISFTVELYPCNPVTGLTGEAVAASFQAI